MSGKCGIDFENGIPTCTTDAIKPLLSMVLVLLAGSLLRYFQ
jgi:hypothetical protein